ncbi:MAG: LamG domain-containing protein [Bryobacteraceae bacterium]
MHGKRAFSRSIFLLISLAALAQTPPSETWTFDRLDRLGRHPATVLGNPRVIDTPEGKAIEFDGVDDAIFLDVQPLAGAETFTWEVIFRPDGDGPQAQRFFHLQENGTEHRLLFETRVMDRQWYLDSFAQTSAGSRALMDRKLTHPADKWYHIAAVYDGAEFRNYVDGKVQVAAKLRLSSVGPGRTSVGVRINREFYFKGAIRLARMTRRALTPEEFLKPPRN